MLLPIHLYRIDTRVVVALLTNISIKLRTISTRQQLPLRILKSEKEFWEKNKCKRNGCKDFNNWSHNLSECINWIRATRKMWMILLKKQPLLNLIQVLFRQMSKPCLLNKFIKWEEISKMLLILRLWARLDKYKTIKAVEITKITNNRAK